MNHGNAELLQYLHEHSSVLLLALSKDGLITRANNYAVKVAGRALNNTPLLDFFTDFNAQLNIERLLSGGVQHQLLNVNTFNQLPQTFYFTTLKTEDGILLIGEMSSLEVEELHKTMIELNNELNNMTRELQKKNIQLDQLNKMKNQFLGMAAHDLRNPIASIYMFSEFVLDSQGDEISDDLKQIMELIKKSSQFMLNMLEELLDVVKIESGKLELKYEDVDLQPYLTKIIRLNAIIAESKKIKMVLNTPQLISEMRFDPVKIEQVLNNLISNAIKYSHPNTTITISAFSTGREVMISVQDQGQGIPQNEVDKVFVPFAKISVKGTAGERSTGLGLSIVKKIVIGHRGRIWLNSEQGKGTTVHFTLPL
jgi:signal transduction histidine kinase